MSKKQYIVEPAYHGNHIVLMYVNGQLKHEEIVSGHSLDAYTSSVENLGYTRAYYIPVLERRLEKAYAAYREAVEAYEKAKPYQLELDENEAKALMGIVGEWGKR